MEYGQANRHPALATHKVVDVLCLDDINPLKFDEARIHDGFNHKKDGA